MLGIKLSRVGTHQPKVKRPEGALTVEQYDALPEDHPLWNVYYATPYVEETPDCFKASNTRRYKHHRGYPGEKYSTQGELLVYDTRFLVARGKRLINQLNFVNDHNLDTTEGHNNNFLFADYESAKAYADSLSPSS